MIEPITLGQLLKILKPDELINLYAEINEFVTQGFFTGKVEALPADYCEKYKDFPVTALYTPYYQVKSPEVDEKLEGQNVGFQISLAIPETYPYHGYSLKKFLDTLGDEEEITIFDGNCDTTSDLFVGKKKDIPADILSQVENREVAFAEKLTYVPVENESNDSLQIILQEESN